MRDFLEFIALCETGRPDMRRVLYRGAGTDLFVGAHDREAPGLVPSTRHAAQELRARLLRQDREDVIVWLRTRHPETPFSLILESHGGPPSLAPELAYVVVVCEPRSLRRTLRAEATRALSALGWRIFPRGGDVYDCDEVVPADLSAHARIMALARIEAALSLVRDGAAYPRLCAPFCRSCRSRDVIRVDSGWGLLWNDAVQCWDWTGARSAPADVSPGACLCRACGKAALVHRYIDNGEPCDREHDLFPGETITDEERVLLGRARILELR